MKGLKVCSCKLDGAVTGIVLLLGGVNTLNLTQFGKFDLPTGKVEIFLEQREVAFLSPIKIAKI